MNWVVNRSPFFAGGKNGEWLHEMLQKEQIQCKPIPVEGETRESLVIIDYSSDKEFRIVVEGPQIHTAAFDEIIMLIENVKPSWLIASGSLPRGLANDAYAKLAKIAKRTNSRLILDTSGEALEAALVEGVYLIKPNLKELSSLCKVDSLHPNQVPQAAMELISQGKAEVIIVSMSSAGALLVTRDMHRHVPSPEIEPKSTVGAGDSMVSGMVWAMQQNKSLTETVCWGVACGSAATMNTSTKLFKKNDAEKLFLKIREKVDF